MYVHETLHRFYTTTPQKICPMLRQQSQKMCFVGSHSQVYYDNFHNKLFADFQCRVLLSTEALSWSLTKPQNYDFILSSKAYQRHSETRAAKCRISSNADQSPFQWNLACLCWFFHGEHSSCINRRSRLCWQDYRTTC